MTAETLLSILVRGAALLALVGAGALALRRASAAHRHLAWAVGAAALLALPAISLTMPPIPWAVLPAAAPRPAQSSPRPAIVAPKTADVREPGVAAHSPMTPTPDFAPDVAPASTSSADRPAVAAATSPMPPSPLVVAWLVGALFVALRLVAGARAARRLVARSTSIANARVLAVADEAAARLGAPRTPSVRISDDVDSPITVGALRPHVLLPTSALSWPQEQLRLALLHEFAHVRRRDLLAEFVARLALVVHWANPLAWLAVSRLRIERERACDDLVLRAGHDADEYAGFLVSLARALRPTPTVVAATMAGGPQFERRVEAILDERHSRLAPSAKSVVAFALLASLALSFAACVQPTPTTNEEPKDDVEAAKAASYTKMLENREAQGITGVAQVAPIVVALDGSGQFTSISAALDAAPAGAVIRVGPGTFDERLVVAKAVTIEGAGADKTTIVGPGDAAHPTLRIAGVRGVVVRGLTLTGRGAHVAETLAPGAVVDVSDASVRFENVAVVGGPASGVVIGQGADVEIVGCLVAGVWNNGISVGPAGDHSHRVRIAQCDIRNCWSRGITIGRGNRDVVIEGCRISGASWHGIRYDSAAPTVTGNVIFDNVRSGIYASGTTEGHIEGNLFFENGMSDVSCWLDARDLIEQNWFVNSKREAVAILGASAPVVRKNVFYGCKTALMASGIADGKGPQSQCAGGGAIEDNALCNVGTKFQKPSADGKGVVDAALPEGNKTIDMRFDGEKRPLTRESFGRQAAADGAKPLTFESPWPARPEEAATAPKPEPEDLGGFKPIRFKKIEAKFKSAKGNEDAVTTIARIKADILQIADPERRERGLVDLGDALRSDDPNVARPALASLFELRDVKYDKSRFRADVLRQLASADSGVQTASAYALMQVERDPADRDRVLTIAEATPVPSGGVLHVAMMLSQNRVDGRLADLFVKALAVDDPRRGAMDTANYLRGMWVAPAVEDAVVAAWRRHPTMGGPRETGLWPYIFGQMLPGPRESRVRAIFELIASGDDSARQLTERAITKPVDESARALAAQLAADGIATAPTAALRRTYLDVIKANGGREQVATLRALADNAMVGDDLRALAAKIADELERR
jgi:parallel beta-helix repeat protein